MRNSIFQLLVLLLMTAPVSAVAKGPFGSIKVGNWSGGAYTFDNTGAFSHCAAGSTYLNGINLIVAKGANGVWTLSFGSVRFNATIGPPVPITLTFDGQHQFALVGSAITPKLISAVMPNSAVRQFQRSSLMVVTSGAVVYEFNLKSSGHVVSAVENCVSTVKADGLARATDFTAIVRRTPATKQEVKAAGAEKSKAPDQQKLTKTVAVNGTGFLVDSEGHIVTNSHVVANCVGDIQGSLPGQAPTTLRLVTEDGTNDLALLKANISGAAFVRLRDTNVRAGESVMAIGYPYHGLLTSDFTVTTGIVSSLSGILNDTRYVQTTAPVQPGNSGGPLLDGSGNLVGVVAAKINAIRFAKVTGDIPEGINFAIKIGALRDFLDNSAIQYQAAKSTSEVKATDVAEAARAYTMLITCHAVEQAKKN